MFPQGFFCGAYFTDYYWPKRVKYRPTPPGPLWVPAAKGLAWLAAAKELTWVPAQKPLTFTPRPRCPMASTPLPKDPADDLPFTMNFGLQPEIIGGDAITSCSVSAAPLPGFTGSLSCSTVSINGPLCTSVISGGSDGNDYGVRFVATLNSGAYTRVLGGIIQVRQEAGSEP